MRKKKTFEYTSYFAAEFNGFLQYRISGGSNGLEERRVLKSLDDYLIQSGMVKKKLDGIIVDAWINSLNVGGNTKAHCNGVQREHNKKLNNGLPILHKVPPKRDYGRYFCIMAEKGGTSHGGLTEKLSLFFHAKKQEVNAYGR